MRVWGGHRGGRKCEHERRVGIWDVRAPVEDALEGLGPQVDPQGRRVHGRQRR